MSTDELSSDLHNLSMEHKCQDGDSNDNGHQERGRLTRKSSTASSTGSSSLDKRKLFYRKDSEVKIEAIFKELFSPDAKIIDHYEGEFQIPGVQMDEIEDEVVVPSHERFKLRRQTSLAPKAETKRSTPIPAPRIRISPRKSPAPMRKTSTPTQRKRSTSSRAPPLPKLSAPPSLKPNFVTVSDDVPAYIRKNPIPLRRGLSVAQK